jgi:hypothetical protein
MKEEMKLSAPMEGVVGKCKYYTGTIKVEADGERFW